jgi:hypothetical protein
MGLWAWVVCLSGCSDPEIIIETNFAPANVCAGLTTPEMQVIKDAAQDWTLAIEPTFKHVKLDNPSVLLLADQQSPLAGFLLSRVQPSGGIDGYHQLQGDLALLSRSAFPGSKISINYDLGNYVTHDHFKAQSAFIKIDLQQDSAELTLEEFRNQLVAGLTHPTVPLSITLPAQPARDTSTSFVAYLTVITREHTNLLLVGISPTINMIASALLDRASVLQPQGGIALRLINFTSGTALARFNQSPWPRCDSLTIQTLPKADIVIITKPLSLMNPALAQEVNHALEYLLSTLGESYLDYRIGVMHAGCTAQHAHLIGDGFLASPTGADPELQDSADPSAAWRKELRARLNSPPQGEDPCRFSAPMTAGQLFFQSAEKTDTLRSDAKVLYFYITDEDERYPSSTDHTFQQLQNFYKNQLKLFVIGITAPAGNTCGLQPSTEINTLIATKTGTALPICGGSTIMQNLAPLLIFMEGLNSPYTLGVTPIASTLGVSLRRSPDLTEVPLYPSLKDGFFYLSFSSTLCFTMPMSAGNAPRLGDTITYSYSQFADALE